MLNRGLLFIVVLLSVVLISIKGSFNTFFNSTPNIRINEDNIIKSINLEEYVIGVVAAEMPASFNIEALKAQAVAARTYATYKMQHSKKNYDVVTDVSNQSYISVEDMKKKWNNDFSKYYSKIETAVNATKGEVITYDGSVIEAFYFALSNGWTEDSNLVFSEDKDYLKSVSSTYDINVKNFEATKVFSQNDICNALNIPEENLTFSDVERSSTNRVNYITINNKKYKGTDIRKKLKLRSTDFNITKEGNSIIITTKGYGHGVGMSQYGANGMAIAGATYEEILKHYYKNTKIHSI